MKAFRFNFLIDALAFICFTFLISTGVIMHSLLPPGSGHSNTIWSMNRHDWGTIHFWLAIVFLSILIVHLFRHWDWIKRYVKGKHRAGSKSRILVGIIGLLVLVAIALAPILTSVKTTNIEKGDHGKAQQVEQADSPAHHR